MEPIPEVDETELEGLIPLDLEAAMNKPSAQTDPESLYTESERYIPFCECGCDESHGERKEIVFRILRAYPLNKSGQEADDKSSLNKSISISKNESHVFDVVPIACTDHHGKNCVHSTGMTFGQIKPVKQEGDTKIKNDPTRYNFDSRESEVKKENSMNDSEPKFTGTQKPSEEEKGSVSKDKENIPFIPRTHVTASGPGGLTQNNCTIKMNPRWKNGVEKTRFQAMLNKLQPTKDKDDQKARDAYTGDWKEDEKGTMNGVDFCKEPVYDPIPVLIDDQPFNLVLWPTRLGKPPYPKMLGQPGEAYRKRMTSNHSPSKLNPCAAEFHTPFNGSKWFTTPKNRGQTLLARSHQLHKMPEKPNRQNISDEKMNGTEHSRAEKKGNDFNNPISGYSHEISLDHQLPHTSQGQTGGGQHYMSSYGFQSHTPTLISYLDLTHPITQRDLPSFITSSTTLTGMAAPEAALPPFPGAAMPAYGLMPLTTAAAPTNGVGAPGAPYGYPFPTPGIPGLVDAPLQFPRASSNMPASKPIFSQPDGSGACNNQQTKTFPLTSWTFGPASGTTLEQNAPIQNKEKGKVFEFGNRGSFPPNRLPCPGDTRHQIAFEQYLEMRKGYDPKFAAECKARQAKRIQRARTHAQPRTHPHIASSGGKQNNALCDRGTQTTLHISPRD
jgi:hypothetical protein